MIKKIYNFADYIIESLLLESKMELSDKLVMLLKQIRANRIAKELLSISSDKDYAQNYIDITDSKDELSFTPSLKVKELLKGEFPAKYIVTNGGRYLTHSDRNNTIFKKLGYQVPSRDPWEPSRGTIGTIKAETISNTTGSQYCWFVGDDGRETIINKEALRQHDDRLSNIWTFNRNKIRTGRLIRSILNTAKIKFTDKEIEDFVNLYKSAFEIQNNSFLKFKLVKGEDIAYWYNKDRYEGGGRSTLGNSCMADVDSEYFDIYCNNENCSLLILFGDSGSINTDGSYKSDKIKGRALVWKTTTGDVFMDRIYTNYDSDINLFKEYAFKNGWWCKTDQDSSTEFTAMNGTDKKEAKYVVKLENADCRYYPYVDTLSYINVKDGYISNSDIDAEAELRSTSGYIDYFEEN